MLFISFIIISIGWLLLDDKKPKAVQLTEKDTRVLRLAAREFQKTFEWGDLKKSFQKGEFSCPNRILLNDSVHPDFLRCNPDYVHCLLKSKDGKFSFSHGKDAHVVTFNQVFENPKNKEKQYFDVISRYKNSHVGYPDHSYLFEVQNERGKLQFLLEDTCRDVYLPQRKYAIGPYKGAENFQDEFYWDNFERHLFIDKEYISNRDVVEFNLYSGDKIDVKKITDLTRMAFPATNLMPEDMRKVCAFRGKRLMESHLFDAATFFPANPKEKNPDVVFRGPYPWSYRPDGFLYEYQYGEEKTANLSLRECRKAYVQECQGLTAYIAYSNNSLSWLGIKHSIGGYFEYMVNKRERYKTIKASSFNFQASSKLNQLGKRIAWDENGHSRQNFTIGEEEEFEHDFYEIAFRCYKEK